MVSCSEKIALPMALFFKEKCEAVELLSPKESKLSAQGWQRALELLHSNLQRPADFFHAIFVAFAMHDLMISWLLGCLVALLES